MQKDTNEVNYAEHMLLLYSDKTWVFDQSERDTTGIWEHEGNVENTRLRLVFSTFLECPQMSGVFYHSVIHGLGFFICFKM